MVKMVENNCTSFECCLGSDYKLFKQGAEARLFLGTYNGKECVVKERFKKTYRHPDLDEKLTRERVKAEERIMLRCRKIGVATPTLYLADRDNNCLIMEYIKDGVTARSYIDEAQKQGSDSDAKVEEISRKIGRALGLMHKNNVIHGDLTTSNMMLRTGSDSSLLMLDFGLSHVSYSNEDKGVDLYVLERALLSTHPNSQALFDNILASYAAENEDQATKVLEKLDEVRQRGRKRTMVG